MAYSKQNFQDGQILNAANLEAMENGIIAGQGAHNLLDNSDFRNPVNQRGIYDTTESENLRYTIDRWISYLTSIDVSQTGMLLSGQFGSGYNTIYQYVPLTPDGRIYTAALYYADGTVKCASGDFLTKAGGVGAEYGVLLEKDSDGKPYVQLYTYDGKRIIGAALYEGSYTADTLPSYVPKGKRVEMLNCGVSLAPHNLLNNSDFRDPVISKGIGAIYDDGKKYICDRWYDTYGLGTYSLNEGVGITLSYGTNHCYCVQKINNASQYYGKTMTLAIQLSNGTIYVTSGTYLSSSISLKISGGNWEYDLFYDRVELVVVSDSITVSWIALYEGSYDASTLPAYVPKGKHVEMLNCGVLLQPHNLLDNSDFRNFINQRGGTSTAGVWDYCIDRWRAIGTAGQLVWHNSDHVALGALRGISQAIENKSRFVGKTYTLAAKDTDGVLYITSGTYDGDSKHIWKETNGMELRLYSVSDDNNIYFSLKNLSSDTSKFIYLKWAALYEGSYDASTLPAYQPKGYAAELAECQRYYRPMPYPVIPCANNPAGTQVYGFLPFRMRITNPTFSCDTLYFFKGDSTFCSVSSASATSYGAGTRIVFNLSQSVEGNLAGAIAGNGITLSADL